MSHFLESRALNKISIGLAEGKMGCGLKFNRDSNARPWPLIINYPEQTCLNLQWSVRSWVCSYFVSSWTIIDILITLRCYVDQKCHQYGTKQATSKIQIVFSVQLDQTEKSISTPSLSQVGKCCQHLDKIYRWRMLHLQ